MRTEEDNEAEDFDGETHRITQLGILNAASNRECKGWLPLMPAGGAGGYDA
jgi:hypothetical protein